ncbi:hypothetical protein GO013_14570 [Pseudodesulfovibrio sp. JC047]|uniref:hypothetical protein n=1 Tax=Pseudodesulfovibrio sp. JC047 TaxID=2683199 RepID=UPI0013D4BCE9|nr:hypothetical protein [Pseudodesulfovibrio sp. JC047]NDV20632.1 hypothetical protein [Pseudodesulfovibrio sp. JC047]
MNVFISIGRHSFREQELVLDSQLAHSIMTTCLRELHTAGLQVTGMVHLRSTPMGPFESFDLPMESFVHEERLHSEIAAIREMALHSPHEPTMIVRPFMGWTPAPRLRQLAEIAGTHACPCLSLLKQDAQQHIGWNLMEQDRANLVNGALTWTQSPLFIPHPFRQKHPQYTDYFNWPDAFGGSQYLPDLSYFDGTMLTLDPQTLSTHTVHEDRSFFQTAQTVTYDEENREDRPFHEHLGLFRLNDSLPCDLTLIRKMLHLYEQQPTIPEHTAAAS